MKLFLVLLAAVFALNASAKTKKPDKVGNGGAVWICQMPNGEIKEIFLRDIFEAQAQHGLTVNDISVPFGEEVQTKKRWIERYLPNELRMMELITYVEQKAKLVEAELTFIDDGLEKLSPLAMYCAGGQWVPKQLANFPDETHEDVYIRKDLFESPLFSEVERAALYIHEGVYAYLRERNDDTNSSRARKITGLLFAVLPDEEKAARIMEVLGAAGPVDDGGDDDGNVEVSGYLCGLTPGHFSPMYLGEGKTEDEAKTALIAACEAGEKPNFPGMEDGFGDGMFIPPNECKKTNPICEPFTSTQKTVSCTIELLSDDQFTGVGRTPLEAQYEAKNRCFNDVGIAPRCYHPEKTTCK